MKRRLNILCLLVALVLVYSVFESTYYLGSAFMTGFKAGYSQQGSRNTEKIKRIYGMKEVSLFPDNLSAIKDSVYNEKSGTFVPVFYSKIAVNVKSELDVWSTLVTMLSEFSNILLSVLSVILFVKLIISINRSQIFDWKNVRRFRWLGVVLILSFVCSTIPVCVAAYELSGIFKIPGYSLTTYGAVSSLTLVLGLMSLIVGEVFAIGLRMQEEQDLTI